MVSMWQASGVRHAPVSDSVKPIPIQAGPPLALPSARPGLEVARGDRTKHFVMSRLATGTLGLACLSPYLALRGSSTWLDSLLALSLVAPLAAAFLGARTGRLDGAYGLSASASAGLVLCVFAARGADGWPAILWLLAQPIDALAAGHRRPAAIAGLVSAAAGVMALALASAAPVAAGFAAPADAATFFLAASALVEVVFRSLARQPAVPPRAAESVDGAAMADILDLVGDLVTRHDVFGDVVEASGSAHRLMNVPAFRLRGRGYFGHVHIPDRPAYLKALSDAANGSSPVTVEFRVQVGSEAGSPGSSGLVWMEMRACRLRRPQPDGTAVIAVTRDASASHRHAAELDAARQEAVRGNELKGRFLATVSHELRTPLNAIIGFSELLSADHSFVVTEERRKEYATIIRNSGHHLLEVVNTLLDVSKIESGNFPFEPEPFDPTELARGCCDLMQLKADEGNVRLVRQIEPALPAISGDRRACRQILINLLSNAVKFTPASGTVTLAIHREGGSLVVAVSDDGIGIRETDLPRLGEAFFQVGDIHRRPQEGTGLGLSVVRGLVGLHRGTIAIESGPGVGTAVTIRLPIEGAGDAQTRGPAKVRILARPAARVIERKSA